MENQNPNGITFDETVAITNTSDRELSFDFFEEKMNPTTNKVINVPRKVVYKPGETKIMLGGVGAIHAQSLANLLVIDHNNPSFAWSRDKRDAIARSLMQRADDILARVNTVDHSATLNSAVTGSVKSDLRDGADEVSIKTISPVMREALSPIYVSPEARALDPEAPNVNPSTTPDGANAPIPSSEFD